MDVSVGHLEWAVQTNITKPDSDGKSMVGGKGGPLAVLFCYIAVDCCKATSVWKEEVNGSSQVR